MNTNFFVLNSYLSLSHIKIQVEYYGSPVSLKSIAQISAPDASSILVQPYDKSSLKAIEKPIGSSEVDLTPNDDGEVIRLVIPLLTSERRKELSKVVAKQAEEGKVAIINVRRDAMRAYVKLEKDKKVSEDNVKDLSSDLQKLTVAYMKKVESLQKQKEKELLSVCHINHKPICYLCVYNVHLLSMFFIYISVLSLSQLW